MKVRPILVLLLLAGSIMVVGWLYYAVTRPALRMQETTSGEGYPGRDVWKDNREDVIYCHTDMVLNLTAIKTADIGAWIDEYIAAHPTLGIMSLMIHEAYCLPDYRWPIRDYEERILSAIRHVYDKGYRSASVESLCFE